MWKPMRERKAHAEAGFTLVEVIVAFAIVALAVAVLLETFGGGLMTVRRTQAKVDAVLLASSKLEEFGIALPLPGQLVSGVEHGYSWSVTATAHPSLDRAFWLHVTVAWQPTGQRQKEQVTLTTLQTR